MTRFSDFTDEELDAMEEAFCNEGLKYLIGEVRKEREDRKAESEDIEKIDCSKTKCENCTNHNYCDYESQTEKGE